MSPDVDRTDDEHRRIAAICAPHPNHNPGMRSVDLALAELARRHPDLQVTYYRITVPELDGTDSDVPYEDLIENWDAICSSDRILFWGDFHQMRSYIREMDERRRVDAIQDAAATSRYLLLEGAASEVKGRAVGFGGTLLHNASDDYATASYRENLRDLLRTGRRWWFRDPYSAAQAAALVEDHDRSYLGTDASLLLPHLASGDDTEPDEGRDEGDRPVGIFLGRGYASYAERFRFARILAGAIGRPTTWIPWMPDRGALRSRRFRARHPVFARRAPTDRRPLRSLFREITGCGAVVTDTYHLALNAWRLGVPTVCIGHDVSPLPLDVSSGPRFEWRDKRHVFYSMYGLQGYYVHERELGARDLLRPRLDQLRERLSDPADDVRLFRERVNSERGYFEAQLVEALRS